MTMSKKPRDKTKGFFFAMNSQGFSCLPACTYLGDRLVSDNHFWEKLEKKVVFTVIFQIDRRRRTVTPVKPFGKGAGDDVEAS